jgi:hypothetical protein
LAAATCDGLVLSPLFFDTLRIEIHGSGTVLLSNTSSLIGGRKEATKAVKLVGKDEGCDTKETKELDDRIRQGSSSRRQRWRIIEIRGSGTVFLSDTSPC